MSEQIIEAIYHEGIFQPITPSEITLREGQKVALSIKKIEDDTEDERAARFEEILNLTKHFYDGLEESEIDEIERAILRRVNFVGESNKAQFVENWLSTNP